jgi:hypothetical protein
MKLEDINNYSKWRRTRNKLKIDTKEYPYLFHSYNNMGLTERSVEIPIIYHYLTTNKPTNVLEVGNVTNYYESYFTNVFQNKTVVDKIEHNYNVITSDIAKYKSEKKFDFIFSISTFEHMDSDLGRNPEHIAGTSKLCTIAADNIAHCYNELLAEGGLMIITAPMGYTPEWDITFKSDCIDKIKTKSLKRKIFKRVNEEEWVQLEENFNLNSPMEYDRPFPYANYVSIFEIRK